MSIYIAHRHRKTSNVQWTIDSGVNNSKHYKNLVDNRLSNCKNKKCAVFWDTVYITDSYYFLSSSVF